MSRFPRTRIGKTQLLTLLALLVASAAGSGCASMAPKADPTHAAYLATAAADVVTTEKALQAGGEETNPLLGDEPSTGSVVAVKAVGWFGLRGLEALIEKKVDRPLHWWERILIWSTPIALQTYASFQNADVARR